MWLDKNPDNQNGFSDKRVVTFLFALVGSWLLWKRVDQLLGLWVNDNEETEVLDLVLHDELGYDL